MGAKKNEKLLAPVRSLGELRSLAAKDARYDRLLRVGAENLGWSEKSGFGTGSDGAYAWLVANASEAEGGSEDGVVDEVNFCRDLV